MKRLPNRAVAPAHPVWTRTLALVCLLLVSAVSFAQAAHIHGQWLPGRQHKASAPADASQLPGGEERCSVCVAMHSALPVSVHVEPAQTVLTEIRLVSTLDRAPATLWHFAMFSRPPPAAGNIQAN
jgi:hypothetical protein